MLRINTLENDLKFEKEKLNIEIEKRKKLQVCYLLIKIISILVVCDIIVGYRNYC